MDVRGMSETDIMLLVLGLIDVVMIANLPIMVIVGGYETFVSRLNLQDHPDEPEWLSHVNAGVLKVKLAMALIGIFIDSSAQDFHQFAADERTDHQVAGGDPPDFRDFGTGHGVY